MVIHIQFVQSSDAPSLPSVNEASNDKQQSGETSASEPIQSGGQLTGNLSVYLLPLPSGHLDSASIVENINARMLPNISASHYYPTLGASREGQYADETILLTEENITDDLVADGFKVGDIVSMTVIKKSAETVKFHIHPSVKKPDGSSVNLSDIRADWSFGNGVSCCGLSLRDGTDVRALVIVVDQAFDSIVVEKFPAIATY